MQKKTRLGRKVAEAVAAYAGLPAELRARFETGLGAARDALSSADDLPVHARRALLEVAGMILTEGFIAGSWHKVHAALAEEAPEMYQAVRELLPRADGTSDLGI